MITTGATSTPAFFSRLFRQWCYLLTQKVVRPARRCKTNMDTHVFPLCCGQLDLHAGLQYADLQAHSLQLDVLSCLRAKPMQFIIVKHDPSSDASDKWLNAPGERRDESKDKLAASSAQEL